MNYIRISNKAGDINRLFLEKLGLSTKREDQNTIGQFGSGSKFAPIAALRNGWQWINVGEDNYGPYQMEYVSENENGIDCIYYKYTIGDEVTLKPSSFTLDAGVLSWDNNFQIFREAFSNALDEHILNNVPYRIDVVDEIIHEPGVFAVYITAAEELLEIVNDFDKWFDINRTPCYKNHLGNLYIPESDEINIYHKGVHIYGPIDNEGGSNIFDYSLKNVALNEERRIRDTYYASGQIAAIWQNIFHQTPESSTFAEAKEVCKRILSKVNDEHWEFAYISSYHFTTHTKMPEGNALGAAWDDMYGDTVMVSPFQTRFIFTLESVYGKQCLVISNDILFDQLAIAGVPTVESVAGDELEFDFIEFTGNKLDMFNIAMKIMQDYDDQINNVNDIKIFLPNDNQNSLLGVAKDSNIYLSTRAFADMETLISTIIHELDHVTSGLKDGDREFRDLADKRIAKLVLELYGENVRNF